MKIRVLAAALLCGTASLAHAQVQYSGPATPGHVPSNVTNSVIQDSGPATAPNATEFGVHKNGGLPLCVTDQDNPPPFQDPYAQMCFALTPSQAQIVINSSSGPPPAPVLVINGVVSPIGGSGANPILTATVTNIAALTGNDWSAYRNAVLILQGYYAAGDGGGGIVVPRASCPNGADGGTGFQDSTGGWWCRPDGPSTLNNLKFGAKVDNASDDTAANRSYLAYLAQFGQFGDTANFVCAPLPTVCISKTNSLAAGGGVVIYCGEHGGSDPTTNPNPFTFAITGTGAWGITLGANTSPQYASGMVGCRLFGLGAGPAMGGVLIDGLYGRFERNRVSFVGEQAILACNGAGDPVPACGFGSHVWRIRDNVALDSLLNHTTSATLTARIGICQIEGQDNQFSSNECGAGAPGLTTVTNATNLFRTAILFTGNSSNVLSQQNVGEFGDVGFYYDSNFVTSVNDNGSDNYGHGIVASSKEVGSFYGLTSNQNSTNNAGLFDEYLVQGGGKQFYGATIPGTSIKPKFGIEDQFVSGSGGFPNFYDAGTIGNIGTVAANLGVKGFTNQVFGSTADAPMASPFSFVTPAGASNFCVDTLGDRGSVFFQNPGSAATVTLATTCAGQAQGWDGMRLRIFIQTNVTVVDSNAVSKTAGNSWHQATLQNGLWSFDY